MNERMNDMRAQPHKPPDEDAVESPNAGADDSQRVNIESPVDTDADADGNTPEAHTPRPHPPVEEPEEKLEEHAPETEP
ncbi:MAG: hypothetical protein ABI900_05550, partial [Betaproteobacteria bacterium]